MEAAQAIRTPVRVTGGAGQEGGADPAGAARGTASGADVAAAAARQARFGRLPERVGFADMVQEQAAPKDPARDAYQAAGSFVPYSCLALDLGL